MISRLIDVLVIRAMRLWVATAPPENRGWLGALADARISRALKTIHDEPFRRRTVAELAGIAGMSRSSFADRFASLIGAAPLHYQTRWKLLLANEMLKRPDTRVSDVARRIGYDSDAAFSRAFKRWTGESPHRYLLRQRLERAQRLVIDSTMPFAQIARSLGFYDQSHFGHHFKRHFGATPRETRERKNVPVR